jgi:glutaredoxin
MLVLYMRPTCPYCHKVEAAARQLGISLEEKDIADLEVETQLVQRGGKKQVPYLVDTAHGIEMYESEDIIVYMRNLFPSSPQE